MRLRKGAAGVYLRCQPNRSPDGTVLSRWKLTEEEREAIYLGADVFLYVHTFNQPLQPIRLEIPCCGEDLARAAAFMGLLE